MITLGQFEPRVVASNECHIIRQFLSHSPTAKFANFFETLMQMLPLRAHIRQNPEVEIKLKST